jgi:NAD(P)-dependent dehydrogenase (short-subunit alcohol dehydrogenase family)
MSAYSTSKAALIRLTENLAVELADSGVSVFAIQPGTVRTAMTDAALRDESAAFWLPWLAQTFQEGRDVPPEKAAQLVLFLASGRADGLSGRFFDVAEDAEGMVQRAEEVKAKDLYLLRMGKLGPANAEVR